MRLWHQNLISRLPNLQLLGQHRELCALRGLGWNKKHSVVNFVFTYPYSYLYYFHMIVIFEMEYRGYVVDSKWKELSYRGKNIGFDYSSFTFDIKPKSFIIYEEHNDIYLLECINNLKNKNINL